MGSILALADLSPAFLRRGRIEGQHLVDRILNNLDDCKTTSSVEMVLAFEGSAVLGGRVEL